MVDRFRIIQCVADTPAVNNLDSAVGELHCFRSMNRILDLARSKDQRLQLAGNLQQRLTDATLNLRLATRDQPQLKELQEKVLDLQLDSSELAEMDRDQRQILRDRAKRILTELEDASTDLIVECIMKDS